MFSLQTIFGKGDKFYGLLEASADAARQSARALIALSKQKTPNPLDKWEEMGPAQGSPLGGKNRWANGTELPPLAGGRPVQNGEGEYGGVGDNNGNQNGEEEAPPASRVPFSSTSRRPWVFSSSRSLPTSSFSLFRLLGPSDTSTYPSSPISRHLARLDSSSPRLSLTPSFAFRSSSPPAHRNGNLPPQTTPLHLVHLLSTSPTRTANSPLLVRTATAVPRVQLLSRTPTTSLTPRTARHTSRRMEEVLRLFSSRVR